MRAGPIKAGDQSAPDRSGSFSSLNVLKKSLADKKPSRSTLWRHEKRDKGLMCLRVWVDEVEVPDLLVIAGHLPAHLADDKKAIEKALESYLRAGRAATFEP